MRKEKGFTLIELLAVIVILAIIMVIAVPQILNVIDSSRDSSWNNSTRLIKKSIETNTQILNPNTNQYQATVKGLCGNETNLDIDVTDNIKSISDIGDMQIKCKKDTNYIFTLIGINQFSGRTSTITCVSEGRCNYSISSSNAGVIVGPTNKSVGTIVYFDPVSTDKCDSETFNVSNVKNGTSTCYKWRIISENGNNLTVQLDHNLINQVRWSSTGYNSNGPDNILTSLASATSSWSRVPALTNFTYDTTLNGTNMGNNYGILTCTNGICNTTIDQTTTLVAGTQETPVRARLITGEEITNITQTGSWNTSTVGVTYFFLSSGNQTMGSSEKQEELKWLSENTTSDTCGSTNNEYGSNNLGLYTLSPNYETTNRIWCVDYACEVGESYVYKSDACGARPVITVNKSYFTN